MSVIITFGLKMSEETILSVPAGKVKCKVLKLSSDWDKVENL